MNELSSNFRDYFQQLIESLPYGIIVFDDKGNLLYLNRNSSFMLNITLPNLENKHYGEFLDQKLRDIFDLLIEDTKKQGFVMNRQIKVSIIEEVEITVGLSSSILRDNNGNIEGITIVCQEMTAPNELERMRELDKLKSECISCISHDLKSPLTSILGYAEILMRGAQDKLGIKERRYLEIIKQEGTRLAQMIENMLNMAKIESGQFYLQAERLSIKDIVDEVIKLVSVQATKFRFLVDIDIPLLWLDKLQMKRVFTNLITNAIKYSPDGGDIIIKAYIKNNNIHIDVTDHGIGICEESLSHIFEKFFRVKSEQTKGIMGTGLGLAITKGIVETHGGTVDLESKLGEGSTFSVILPGRLMFHKP